MPERPSAAAVVRGYVENASGIDVGTGAAGAMAEELAAWAPLTGPLRAGLARSDQPAAFAALLARDAVAGGRGDGR
jgi:hypothetical protein